MSSRRSRFHQRNADHGGSTKATWASLVVVLVVLLVVLLLRDRFGDTSASFFELLAGTAAEEPPRAPAPEREDLLTRAARGDGDALAAVRQVGLPPQDISRALALAFTTPHAEAARTLAKRCLRLRGVPEGAEVQRIVGGSGPPQDRVLTLGLLVLAQEGAQAAQEALMDLREGGSPEARREAAEMLKRLPSAPQDADANPTPTPSSNIGKDHDNEEHPG